jgi:hypothetical protein
MGVTMRLRRTLALLILAALLAPMSAYANDPFGRLSVSVSGTSRSEASGGATGLTLSGSTWVAITTIRFRDVAADGWGTKAMAQSQYRQSNPVGWVGFAKPDTAWYGSADGWKIRDLEAGRLNSTTYRQRPEICWHTPWWQPDECDDAGWHYAP